MTDEEILAKVRGFIISRVTDDITDQYILDYMNGIDLTDDKVARRMTNKMVNQFIVNRNTVYLCYDLAEEAEDPYYRLIVELQDKNKLVK